MVIEMIVNVLEAKVKVMEIQSRERIGSQSNGNLKEGYGSAVQ